MIRVLAIDRDPLIRQTIRRSLARSVYAVSLAQSGTIGLERCRRGGPYDLVIADLLMPGQHGAFTILELRALAPLLPILVISSDGRIFRQDRLLERARELGATVTLAKPFTADELRAAVSRCLSVASKCVGSGLTNTLDLLSGPVVQSPPAPTTPNDGRWEPGDAGALQAPFCAREPLSKSGTK